MGAILLLLLIIWGLIISTTTSNLSHKSTVSFILSFILVFIFSGFVTYTPDWKGYEYWIKFGTDRELFFQIVRNILLRFGYGYPEMQLIYTGVYTFMLIKLISRFNLNPYLISLLYIPLIYLIYTTQIRFFMGYYSITLAFYYYYIEKRKLLSVILLIFALVNHYSLILFLPFIYMFSININVIVKKVVLISISVFFLFTLFFIFFGSIFKTDLRFTSYLSSDVSSSFLGGIYIFMPSVITLVLIVKYTKHKITAFPSLLSDKRFQFLFRFSVIPYIFIGIALHIQIIGHRFIFPTVIFQMLLMFYLSKFNNEKANRELYIILGLYFIFNLIYIYLLPTIIFGVKFYEIPMEMIKSNSLLKHLLN